MQFDRAISLNIQLANPPPSAGYRGDLSIEKLRISFSIFKSISWSTNTSNIRIFNLSPQNRNQLAMYGDLIRLSAGYLGNGGPQVIFIGNSTQVSHAFALPDIISTIEAGDGQKQLNEITVNISFAENTPAREIIQFVADKMGLTIVDFAESNNLVYPLGYNDADLAKNILDKVCKKLNLTWTVQNGNLVILVSGKGNQKPIVDVNATNGMIGIPERYSDKRQYLYSALPPNAAPKDGWRVKMLLRPDLLPGDRIRLRSTVLGIDSVFYILTVRHEGDNFGPQFETTLEVVAE